MELYHLKTFITVAEEGHLTRVAHRLNTSQPAVSAHIKGLEAELGLMLFVRTPKGMRLTREGEELRDQAGALKDEVNGFETGQGDHGRPRAGSGHAGHRWRRAGGHDQGRGPGLPRGRSGSRVGRDRRYGGSEFYL